MNARTALISLLPFGLLGVAACAASRTSAGGTEPVVPAAPAVTAPASADTAPTDTAPAVTDAVVAETMPPPTDPPAPPETIPPQPQPIPTIPPVIMPQPQVCLEPSADDEPVEFLATDWEVTYHGATAPECMRIPESFALRFVNGAEGDLTVLLDGAGGAVAAGDAVTTAPLGDMFFVGDEFELVFVQLGLSVTVEVVPHS